MAVKSFVFVKENQFTWRSNFTSYYHLTFSESNRLIVSVICAWLSMKAISISNKIVKNTSSMKQNNWTTNCTPEWSRAHAGDFDLTGKCDWKNDRKCSTSRVRRRFAAVLARFGAVKARYHLDKQPRPRGFSLKNFFEGKALGTRLINKNFAGNFHSTDVE